LKRLSGFVCLFLAWSAVHAASFDCAKASTSIEKSICADSQLSDLDGQLMQAYRQTLGASGNGDAVKAEQRAWLVQVRNKCHDGACLKQAYSERIAALAGAPGESSDGAARPAPAQTSGPAPQEQEAPAATEVVDHAPANDAQPNAATSPSLAEPSGASPAVAEPAKSLAAPAASAPVAPAAAASAASAPAPADKPASLLSDIAHSGVSLIAALIMIGLVKPAWILRWDPAPSRGKLVAYLFPIGFLLGGVSYVTKSEARKVYDEKVLADKRAADDARYAHAEQERAASESRQQGAELYTYFKSVSGNEDRAGYNEQEYVNGQLLSTCNVNGKPRGRYGWIELRTVFIEGQRVKDDPASRLYVFAVVDGKQASVIWRGEEYREAVVEEMKRTCD
jgi:uncharacterized protein